MFQTQARHMSLLELLFYHNFTEFSIMDNDGDDRRWALSKKELVFCSVQLFYVKKLFRLVQAPTWARQKITVLTLYCICHKEISVLFFLAPYVIIVIIIKVKVLHYHLPYYLIIYSSALPTFTRIITRADYLRYANWLDFFWNYPNCRWT